MSALIPSSIPTARRLSMTNINDLVTATLPHHSSGNSVHREFFVNVPDTKIWLTNPAPAGFLRWEGLIVLPEDPIIRVDLISGEKSGLAQSAGS
jgi:hypothetical protein